MPLLVPNPLSAFSQAVSARSGRRHLPGLGAPAEQPGGELLAPHADASGEVRHRAGRHLRLHADPRPHGSDRLQDLLVVDVAVVGAVQRHVEAVGIAGFRQQLLGPVGIVLGHRQVRHVAEQGGGHHVAGGLRKPFHDPVADGQAIDGRRHGIPHPLVAEGVLLQRLAFLVGDDRASSRAGPGSGRSPGARPWRRTRDPCFRGCASGRRWARSRSRRRPWRAAPPPAWPAAG